ncbi:DNA-processing protein DprA [bacterium]|nr:DNA-processing protein DprA [bacterium]
MKEDLNKIQWYLGLSTVKGIGPSRYRTLLNTFGSAKGVFEQSRAKLEQLLSADAVDQILAFRPDKNDFVQKQLEAIESYGANFIPIDSEHYPYLLKQISTAPPFIFASDLFKKADEVAIAMVGTRKPSYYGKGVAEQFAAEFANKGITVVSGFADGVDTAAHRSCLKHGGRTIAVFGCGLEVIYPYFNSKLYREIKEKGILVSEFPMGTKPDAINFPQRNRIISGLSLGTVVIEAGLKSGALITSSYALHQNREVFAVPGTINSPESEGTNRLLQKGAKLVTSVEDILEEFPFIIVPKEEREEAYQQVSSLTEDEKKIYDALDFNPQHIDVLVKAGDFEMSHALSILLALELKGLIKQIPGKRFVRV